MLKFTIIFVLILGLSLAHGKKEKNSIKCGRTPFTKYDRILGGVMAKKSAWPWHVAINYKGNYTCGGSIIDKSWVITSAICLFPEFTLIENTDDLTVDVGLTDRLTPNTWSKTNLKISKIIEHPLFELSGFFQNEIDLTNDIALLKLESPLTFDSSYKVNSVCLPNDMSNLAGKTATLTGWGAQDAASEEYSKDLMQVDLKIIKDSVCKSYFMSSTFFNNQSILIDPKIQLCAGKQNGGKGGCLGDAGDPFVLSDEDSYKLVGLATVGNVCGGISIYTKVGGFLSWIKNVITSN